MIELKENDLVFAKVRPDAIIPTKDNENAGYDIYANFEEDYIIIPPHKTTLISTGIASAISDKYYLQVHERGSTGSKGIKQFFLADFITFFMRLSSSATAASYLSFA